MQEISVIGIDLAKDSFAVCGMSRTGKVLFEKQFSRQKLIEFTANHKATLMAFEACGGSHYFGRLFLKQGHRVKMMAVQRVKAFAPAQKKNDPSDAQAICLAALSESVPCVQIKSVEQQDVDLLINFREQLVKQRVALMNQAHAVGLEFGVALPKAKAVRSLERFFLALENAENELSSRAREIVRKLIESSKALDAQAEEMEKQLCLLLKSNEDFKRLKSVPGIGTMTAAAIMALTGGDVSRFKSGRDFSAYIGLTPRQYSTGGKTRLHAITRSGSVRIRRLLVVGTNSVLRVAKTKEDRVSKWAQKKREQLGYRKASVALANKTARIAFAVLSKKENYKLAN